MHQTPPSVIIHIGDPAVSETISDNTNILRLISGIEEGSEESRMQLEGVGVDVESLVEDLQAGVDGDLVDLEDDWVRLH